MCKTLESLIIPDSVTSVGESAFGDCRSLVSVTIPNGVTSIGDGAFHECYSLESINIPDGVTSIGSGVFSNKCFCTGKKEFRMSRNSFQSEDKLALYVTQRKNQKSKMPFVM